MPTLTPRAPSKPAKPPRPRPTTPIRITPATIRRGIAAASAAVRRLPCFVCGRTGSNRAVPGIAWDADSRESEPCVLPMCRGCLASHCSDVLSLSRRGGISDANPPFMAFDLSPGA
jgi:hypothetical protein